MTHSLTQSKCLLLSWPLFLFLILKILTFFWGSDLRLREEAGLPSHHRVGSSAVRWGGQISQASNRHPGLEPPAGVA